MVGPHSEFDAVLDLCRDQHRRIVLAVLADQRRPVTLDDLTKTVLKHNHHTPLLEVSEAVLREIQLSLFHVHLPKLEASGIIEYDSERHLIEPTDELERVEPHLSAIIEADPALEPPVEL